MANISGKDTKPEILIRKKLFAKGFRFRKNVKTLPGKPDIVLPKYKTAIFINGCFWHKHTNCQRSRLPVTNVKFWSEKIDANVNRDITNKFELEKAGWRVIVIWQCEIKNNTLLEIAFKQLITDIMS